MGDDDALEPVDLAAEERVLGLQELPERLRRAPDLLLRQVLPQDLHARKRPMRKARGSVRSIGAARALPIQLGKRERGHELELERGRGHEFERAICGKLGDDVRTN